MFPFHSYYVFRVPCLGFPLGSVYVRMLELGVSGLGFGVKVADQCAGLCGFRG